MIRPCFLILDPESTGNISTRKLVVETAKMNVITAYSGQEGIETLATFPRVDGVILNANMADTPCAKVVEEMRRIEPQVRIVIVGLSRGEPCPGGDHYLDSFEPQRLLELLRRLVPERVAGIKNHEPS